MIDPFSGMKCVVASYALKVMTVPEDTQAGENSGENLRKLFRRQNQ
jgi:hypothetical protein